MDVIGFVESVWRYPVKSMQGEEVQQAFAGFSGVYGDRRYAFRNSGAQQGFPFLTARDQERMILYKPKYRHTQQAMLPPNLAEAGSLGPGLTPVYGDTTDMMLDVETPKHNILAIDDPALIAELSDGLGNGQVLSLATSDRSMTDCRPVSLFSLRTMEHIGREAGLTLDKRRFRANLFVNLDMDAFAENGFVGRNVRIGAKAVIGIIAPDPRCKMITLDPDTAEAKPEVLRVVAHRHDGNAGLYGAVLVEGIVRSGDEIVLLN